MAESPLDDRQPRTRADPAGPATGAGSTGDPDGNADLAVRFAELRAADRRQIPDANALIDRARIHAGGAGPRSRRRSVSLARFAVPIAAAAALVILVMPDRPGREFRRAVDGWSRSPALGEWQSPTAFLLETPGRDLLRGMPAIGRTGIGTTVPEGPPDERPAGDTTKGADT